MMVENNNEGRGKYKPNSFDSDNTSSDVNDFYFLLSKEFDLNSERTKEAVESAVKTLAEIALEQITLVSNNAIKTIESIIARIDQTLSDQINLIMHHQDFQKLEGSWRGLYYLVSHSHTNNELKIKTLNISQKELRKILYNFRGKHWQDSPIFKKIYEEAYAQIGGEPFCCIMGDYNYDHNHNDINMLRDIALIAEAANAPFIAGASPTLLGLDDWQQKNNIERITKKLQLPEYAAWRSLRESDYSRYLCLILPRFLSRSSYGPQNWRLPIEEFSFEEDINEGDHRFFTWSNAAFALATNICIAYEHFGWPVHIQGMESGGMVLNLPINESVIDNQYCVVGPSETVISDSRIKELISIGLTPLVQNKNSTTAYFHDVRTLHKAPEYDDTTWNINAALETKLPFILAKAQFVHYLKVIVRQKMQGWRQPSDIEDWFDTWISDYIENSVKSEIESDKNEETYQKPLASAYIKVDEIVEKPGYYDAKFYFRPHYQLNGFTVSLRVHCLLPMDEIGENYL